LAERIDLEALRRLSLHERASLVRLEDFARLPPAGATVGEFLDALPHVLAGDVLRKLAARIREAAAAGRTVALALGGHIVKTGVVPYLIDLVDRGIVKALCLHGATAIHDAEIALAGKTSEDVATGLKDGSFGMARETFELMNRAYREGAESGLGRALGRILEEERAPNRHASLMAAGFRRGLPVTVHLTIGADVVHVHPGLDAAAMGRSTYADFLKVTEVVAGLEGGVWLNVGSAVVLPEVFLKALAIARNLKGLPRKFATANLDMLMHYRTRVNVVERPGGEGFQLLGHHELLIPLLHAAVTRP
jgi:hypothetical protein